jgi:hypothetical protein
VNIRKAEPGLLRLLVSPFRLDIQRPSRRAQHAVFVDLRFEIGRFLDQNGRKLEVGGALGEPEKRRRLTREILPAGINPPRCNPAT